MTAPAVPRWHGQTVQKTVEFSQVQFCTILRNAWFDSGYMFCDSLLGALGRISSIFYVKGETGILKSILSCSLARGDKCAQSMLQLLKWFARGNLDIIFTSPSYLAVVCSPSRRFRRIVFEPSMTHSCELSRARGWRGRLGVFTPG